MRDSGEFGYRLFIYLPAVRKIIAVDIWLPSFSRRYACMWHMPAHAGTGGSVYRSVRTHRQKNNKTDFLTEDSKVDLNPPLDDIHGPSCEKH